MVHINQPTSITRPRHFPWSWETKMDGALDHRGLRSPSSSLPTSPSSGRTKADRLYPDSNIPQWSLKFVYSFYGFFWHHSTSSDDHPELALIFGSDPSAIPFAITVAEVIERELVAHFVFLEDLDDLFAGPGRHRILARLRHAGP